MSNPVKNYYDRLLETVREINRKYKQPRISMTKGVRVALLVLRLYLFLLIALLLYKFITLVK